MSFTSLGFLLFLAVLLLAYYLLPPKACRWMLLLAGSLFFYAFSGFLHYILITAASTYVFGRLLSIKNSRVLVAAWLVIHMGILAAVKLPLFGLVMPLGISFYTFQSAGYILDVYRRKAEPERNPAKLALFVSFFPQLIQGPISRHGELCKTLCTPNAFESGNLTAGARRVLWGFFKKLVIADRLIGSVRLMSEQTEIYQGAYVWLNIVVYAVVLYSDFTGGIDIAIGAARMFGIHVTENFNRPFYARDTADYWRRWHITMGTWFRDYLYYPILTGKPLRSFSRRSRAWFGKGFGKRLPVYIVTIVTWFATGVWHGTGANFIAWGLANGFIIIISQECRPLYERFHNRLSIGSTKPYQAFTVVRTFLLMCAVRSFDIYGGVALTFKMLLSGLTPWSAPLTHGIGVDVGDLIVAALGITLLIVSGREMPRRWFEMRPPAVKLSLCLSLALAILVFGVYGYGYNANQFIYNQF